MGDFSNNARWLYITGQLTVLFIIYS